ncbi:MAG: OPT family oligopeptide transporter [Verrucomicrobiota bacterium]|jgi:OPT family oligopeptide transporter
MPSPAPDASAPSPASPAGLPVSRDDAPLPIEGFRGTPEEIERQWFEQVYRGRGDSMAQLTLRAVVMGSVLGGVLSLTNLYIGLKAGWGFGVAITASIVSYAVWTTFYKLGLVRSPMTILENNCMQSTASAAGYSTGTTLVSAFSAYILINGHPLPVGLTMAWVFCIAVLGVTMAIPMKRQLINIEQLRFPDGTAAAETLRALYAKGESGMRAAKALGIAGGLAALSTFLSDGLHLISASLAKFEIGSLLAQANTFVLGKAWMGRTVMFIWDPIFIAAGGIIGVRVGLSLLISGTLCWAVYVPIVQGQGLITADAGYRQVVAWTLWGGTACMVSSGLLSFLLQWRSSLRAFRNLGSMFRRGRATADPLEAIETPISWFFVGQIVSLAAIAYLARRSFDMPLWLAVLAFFMSFPLALVACRVTGETNTTPVGPVGQLTQMTVGALHPGVPTTTLMSANVVSGAAIASADLLSDLRSGYLLGAQPRKQFLAQFFGIFVGTLATVLAFSAITQKKDILGSDTFPAPAAQSWRAVALAMSKGTGDLHPLKKASIGVGAAVGIVLALLPVLFPKKAPYLPSAAGVGLAWTFHWYYSMLFCLGAGLAWLAARASPKKAEDYTYPVASGIIAGGSLMGVALIFYENGPEIVSQLVRQFRGQ